MADEGMKRQCVKVVNKSKLTFDIPNAHFGAELYE